MRSLAIVTTLVALTAVIGCSASEAASEADGEEQGALAGGTTETGCAAPTGKAIVTMATDRREAFATKPDTALSTNQCVINVQYVQVLGLAEAAQTKINKALTTAAKDSGFNVKECEEPFEVDGSAQVRYNADNLLSVATFVSTYASGTPHPNYYGAFISFDLATGERLQLKDIITPEGKDTLKAELTAAINRTKDNEETKAMMVEAAGRLMSASSNVIQDFTVAKTGLRFNLENHVAHVMQGAVRDGGYLVPYAKIKPFLKPGTSIAKLAGAR